MRRFLTFRDPFIAVDDSGWAVEHATEWEVI